MGEEHSRNKHGKTSEILNAYVQNIMGLPVISGANPAKIHQFYELLLFNVQALETLGKMAMFRCRSINYQGSEGTWSERTKTGKNGTLQNSFMPSRDGQKEIL